MSTDHSSGQHADVLVVGGGVIGLTIAWRAAQRGLAVTLVDAGTPGRASHAAAGMLAPITETKPTEESLLRLGVAAAQQWPAFAAELTDATGLQVGYRTAGTLVAGLDPGDAAELDRLASILDRFGLGAERLSSRETRRLEPMLDPGVRAGLLVPGDHSVDPRLLTSALLLAAERETVSVIRDTVVELSATGARSQRHDLHATTTVLAAGCWSTRLAASIGVELAVRPVKGQVLRLRDARGGFLTRTVRGLVNGSHVYLLPRGDGEIVLGATQQELGHDTTVTAGGVWELLRDARALVPGVTELELVESTAGLRPMTPDNTPIVERVAERVLVATGHGRNGVLLAPQTADLITAELAGVPA